MLCESEKRWTVEQLKAHPVSLLAPVLSNPITIPNQAIHMFASNQRQFFYGVDWATIRDIDAPFVPNLRSITDTSYFPTDEIDQTAVEMGPSDPGTDAKKDLAFLGYTWVQLLDHLLLFLIPTSAIPLQPSTVVSL